MAENTSVMCEAGYRFTEGTTGEELMNEVGCVLGVVMALINERPPEDRSEADFGVIYLLRHANAAYSELCRRVTFTDLMAPPANCQPLAKAVKRHAAAEVLPA